MNYLIFRWLMTSIANIGKNSTQTLSPDSIEYVRKLKQPSLIQLLCGRNGDGTFKMQIEENR